MEVSQGLYTAFKEMDARTRSQRVQNFLNATALPYAEAPAAMDHAEKILLQEKGWRLETTALPRSTLATVRAVRISDNKEITTPAMPPTKARALAIMAIEAWLEDGERET